MCICATENVCVCWRRRGKGKIVCVQEKGVCVCVCVCACVFACVCEKERDNEREREWELVRTVGQFVSLGRAGQTTNTLPLPADPSLHAVCSVVCFLAN